MMNRSTRNHADPTIPMISPFITRHLAAALCLMAASAAAETKRVMILNPHSRDTAPFSALAASFRTTLASKMGGPVDFQEIPLDMAKPNGSGDDPWVNFLDKKLRAQSVDLVVPLGGTATQFADRHRARLFPDTPLLLAGTEPRLIPATLLDQDTTYVTQVIDLPGMVHQILSLKPKTKHIAVVLGSSEIEKLWAGICRREFTAFSDRVSFLWLDNLPFGEMIDRCSKLPPDSFIFHGLFLEDADGIPCEKSESLRRLRQSANAPVFSFFSSELGLGPVGGYLYRNEEIGEHAARVAARILRGEAARSIPPHILKPGTPTYDGRELRRWNIRKNNLPPDHVILFHEPGFWIRYRWQTLGIATLGFLQASLIFGLLVNRSKLRRAEHATALIADISSKFVHLPASDVDHEIHDAQRRICALLDIDMSVLWQWGDATAATLTATHIYQIDGGPLPPVAMNADDFPWVRQEILSGRTLVLRSLDDLPPTAANDRASALRMGIRSSLSLPLSLGGDTPIGILGFNTTRKERDWPPDLIERLKLVAEIIANALARKKADHDLRESAHAQRTAMQQTMELRDTLAHTGRVSLLGQLASALAHELSQPLGAILRNAEAAEIMLRQTSPDTEELRAIIQDILRDDQRAGNVIHKLRSLLGKGQLKLQPLDLADVISDVLTLVKADAASRHVHLASDIEPGLPPILGDRIHLQQVLLNLIVNAMDALGSQDQRTVRVLARRIDPATAEVRVCDNGPGIPESEIGRLFEPFFTTKATGMGMGLPVSQTIIEAHNGNCTRKTAPTAEPASASPCEPRHDHGTPKIPDILPSARCECTGSQPPVIHLVDDDVSHLRSLSRLLRASGYLVRIHDSATEFLANLPDGEHGCVITDLMMPEMDGIALQQALRDAGNPLPVVFLTGHGDVQVTVKAMKNGAEDFLTKNAPGGDLLAAVHRALERDRATHGDASRLHRLRQLFASLSNREREVLHLVLQGRLNKQIAADLGIHERTVKLHRTHITTKLGVRSVAELSRLALQAGID
jgi:FixJ family two-component response regulator/signal transduction histidine kinase/ABC-type uncharacterized transport system substrate-binding protein